MKKLVDFVASTLLAGLLIVVPIYLAMLLLFKAMNSLVKVVKPFAHLLPEWLPGEQFFSLLLVLTICFLIGLAGRTKLRQATEGVLHKIPGYELFRSLGQRLAGQDENSTWKPALVEIEEALVPGFIIEALSDGRYTVFVPSVPTPLAGAIYILTPERVHPLDVPLTQAFKAVARWGSGAKDLVAAMEKKQA